MKKVSAFFLIVGSMLVLRIPAFADAIEVPVVKHSNAGMIVALIAAVVIIAAVILIVALRRRKK